MKLVFKNGDIEITERVSGDGDDFPKSFMKAQFNPQ